MSDPIEIKLDVTDEETEGYLDVLPEPSSPSSGGKKYYYKYTGGTHGDGNVTEPTGTGSVELNIQLTSDRRYQFTGTYSLIVGDTQIGNLHRVSDTEITLTDFNNNDLGEVDKFAILVVDTGNNNCEFWCDPRVTNQVQ